MKVNGTIWPSERRFLTAVVGGELDGVTVERTGHRAAAAAHAALLVIARHAAGLKGSRHTGMDDVRIITGLTVRAGAASTQSEAP